MRFLKNLIELKMNAVYSHIPEMHLKSARQRADFAVFAKSSLTVKSRVHLNELGQVFGSAQLVDKGTDLVRHGRSRPKARLLAVIVHVDVVDRTTGWLHPIGDPGPLGLGKAFDAGATSARPQRTTFNAQRDAALTQVGDNLFQLLIGGSAEHPLAIQFEDLNMPRSVLPWSLEENRFMKSSDPKLLPRGPLRHP
jgi:hypothetical protein